LDTGKCLSQSQCLVADKIAQRAGCFACNNWQLTNFIPRVTVKFEGIRPEMLSELIFDVGLGPGVYKIDNERRFSVFGQPMGEHRIAAKLLKNSIRRLCRNPLSI
jgi:hypothetical protein